jgi:pimeloyl-ACP methyl ester carboxylesterase
MPRLRRCQPGQHFNGFFLAPLALGLVISGCVNDVELDEEDQNIDVDAVTRSIFDPTNPVEVLQLIPAPTAIAQVDPADEDMDGLFGDLDFDATAPLPCEGFTTASCLPVASQGGWPTSVEPELFFSSPIVTDTASAGIVLLEVQENGIPAPLAFSIQQMGLEAPPDECLAEAGLGPDEEPVEAFTATNRVVVSPDAGFQGNRRYLIFATRALRGEPRTVDGEIGEPRPVEPSGLFFLLALNGDAPVVPNEDGTLTITGALATQVESSVRAALGPEATEEMVEAAIQESAQGLLGLQRFFRGLADVAEQVGIPRDQLVFANAWSTGGPGREAFPKVVFAPDPTGANNQVPFPNVPLLTTATVTESGPDVMNAIPSPGGSPLIDAIFSGLNTLNGFGTTTPIALSTTAPIDPDSVEGNVLLLPYDAETNTPIGQPVDVRVTGADMPTGTDVNGRDIYSLTVQPLDPLLPDTFYSLGITSGLQDESGRPFIQDDSYVPLTQTSTNAIRTIVTCGGIDPETGELPPNEEVEATLLLIENQLARERWQPSFEVFESLSTPLPRENLAVAVPYKTQDIVATVDVVDRVLLPSVYPMLPDPSMLPPVQQLPLPTINPMNPNPTGYVGQEAQIFICSQLCAQGLFQLPVGGSVPIAPNACTDDIAALLSHNACQLNASNVNEVRLFSVRNYRLTAGNPQVAGTFTETTVQQPNVERMLVWYVAGGDPAPAEGRPAMLFQHGLGSSKETGLLIANTLAGSGWSTFLMDLPFHGDRASDIVNNGTGEFCPELPDPAAVQCDPTTGQCTGGCDGQQDPSGTGFLGLNVFAVRDNFRQSTVDHLTLIDHIVQGRFDAATVDEVDPDRIGYIGQSLGGITGGVTAAFAEDLEATVLNAAGGSLTTILLNSVPEVSGGLLQALADLGICTPVDPMDITQGCQPTPEFNQFILLAQTALDPGDPLANAVGVSTGTLPMRPALGTDRVMQQMALPDPVVANLSSFLLGGAYGFVDLATQMPTSDQFQIYDFTAAPNDSCHGWLLTFGDPLSGFCGADINDAICNTYGAQAQAAAFVDSAGMTVGPQQPTDIGGIIQCQ